MGKHRKNKVKVEHTLLEGLEKYLNIISQFEGVKTIVPGRISRNNRGRGSKGIFLKYRTNSGFKLLYKNGTSVQEVFVVCSNVQAFERQFKEAYGYEA